jgi:hypothetical protein
MSESGQGHGVVLGSVAADAAQGRRARCKAISLHILKAVRSTNVSSNSRRKGGGLPRCGRFKTEYSSVLNTPWMATCMCGRDRQAGIREEAAGTVSKCPASTDTRTAMLARENAEHARV